MEEKDNYGRVYRQVTLTGFDGEALKAIIQTSTALLSSYYHQWEINGERHEGATLLLAVWADQIETLEKRLGAKLQKPANMGKK